MNTHAQKFSRRRSSLAFIRAAIAAAALLPSAAGAQFDFSGAVAMKLRTYPVKRENGRPAPGKDGMPQPESLSGGRPAGLQELPAVPVDEDFPGGSILDALQHYQKEDPMAALAAMVALLKNGYLEMEIEKSCVVDSVKFQYDQRSTLSAPTFQEAGLAALKQIVADGAKAEALERAYSRLLNGYNNGLSTDRKRDQDMMEVLRRMRYAIAMRYNPRVKTPALAALNTREAKERFKAEVAKGNPVEGELTIGPIELAIKAKMSRNPIKPPPASCKK